MTDTTIMDWARGDLFGIDFPAHPEALKSGGPEFLTRAFRKSGTLEAGNSVTHITGLDEWMLGGTGVKALLSVTYERDVPGLSRNLFIKFSRNLQDKVRDSGRYHRGRHPLDDDSVECRKPSICFTVRDAFRQPGPDESGAVSNR
jgi:hypothetical protein